MHWHLFTVLAQIPTPTPLPPAEPVVDIEPMSDLWNAVPNGIQVWNSYLDGSWATVFQMLVIVFLVIVCGFIIVRAFQKFTKQDAEG